MSERDPSDDALRVLLEDSAEDLYENAPCGYLSVLLDGTVVKVNETFLSWTGHERAALVGRVRFPSLLTVGGRIFYETHLAPMLRLEGGVREIALDLVLADGGTLPVLVNSRVRTDSAGNPLLVRIMLLDARERTGYERELLRARRAAQESEERVRALQQATSELAAAGGVQEAVEAVARAAARIAEQSRAEVWLLHPDTRALAPRAPGGTEATAGDAARLTAALHAGEPVLTAPGGAPVAEALLPLVVDSGPVGVLRLVLDPPRPLADAQRDALASLASQAALALSRARLHEQTALAAARSGFLARLGRELQEVPGVAERTERLAELAAAEAGDGVVVMVPEQAGWRVAAASPAGRASQGAASTPPPASWTAAADRAAATDSPQVLAVPAGGAAGGRRPATVVVPLRAHGRALGAMVLTRPGGEFFGGDLVHLMDVADRGGLALENARLYEREHGVAHALQRSLLPESLPDEPRVELVPHYRPAVEGLDVGGDWYDAFEVAPGVLAVAVGDVVGRGIGAASAMGQLRSAIRAVATERLGPARLLERLDLFVAHAATARMATVAYLEVDVARGLVRYACAGHPPMVVLDPGRPARLEWGARSAPLGARAGAGPRAEATVELAPGARLLLYTDGLVERRRRPLADGLALLTDRAEAHRDRPLPDLVAAVAEDLLGGVVGLDDVCVLAVGSRALAPLRLTVPARLDRLSGVRARLRDWLAGGAVAPHHADALVLATSEAVANAVEHGCAGLAEAEVTVSVREADGDVEVRVADPGRWAGPAPAGGRHVLGRRPDPVDERGRGLLIVGELADSVQVERGEGTTLVLRRQVRGSAGERR